MRLDESDYELPPELIAQRPSKIRDRARLLVLDRGRQAMTHSQVRDLADILSARDVLVLNDTRVFPARLVGQRDGSGGRVEILLVRQEKGRRWQALVRPSQRLRVGAEVRFTGTDWTAVIGEADPAGTRRVEFLGQGDFRAWLARSGRVPLPPYIKRSDDVGAADSLAAQTVDRRRYQTVYARHRGSVAAPTAGLHLTRPLLHRLQGRGVEVYAITLHVGPGTFRPMRHPLVEAHSMDAEHYRITPSVAASIEAAKAAGKRIIAVGTTTTRTLESAADADGRLRHLEADTALFIHPGYRFRVIDGLLTNFHLPRSTPLMLTMALAGREAILRAYQEAIDRRYRFYSYGDAMLIL